MPYSNNFFRFSFKAMLTILVSTVLYSCTTGTLIVSDGVYYDPAADYSTIRAMEAPPRQPVNSPPTGNYVYREYESDTTYYQNYDSTDADVVINNNYYGDYYNFDDYGYTRRINNFYYPSARFGYNSAWSYCGTGFYGYNVYDPYWGYSSFNWRPIPYSMCWGGGWSYYDPWAWNCGWNSYNYGWGWNNWNNGYAWGYGNRWNNGYSWGYRDGYRDGWYDGSFNNNNGNPNWGGRNLSLAREGRRGPSGTIYNRTAGRNGNLKRELPQRSVSRADGGFRAEDGIEQGSIRAQTRISPVRGETVSAGEGVSVNGRSGNVSPGGSVSTRSSLSNLKEERAEKPAARSSFSSGSGSSTGGVRTNTRLQPRQGGRSYTPSGRQASSPGGQVRPQTGSSGRTVSPSRSSGRSSARPDRAYERPSRGGSTRSVSPQRSSGTKSYSKPTRTPARSHSKPSRTPGRSYSSPSRSGSSRSVSPGSSRSRSHSKPSRTPGRSYSSPSRSGSSRSVSPGSSRSRSHSKPSRTPGRSYSSPSRSGSSRSVSPGSSRSRSHSKPSRTPGRSYSSPSRSGSSRSVSPSRSSGSGSSGRSRSIPRR